MPNELTSPPDPIKSRDMRTVLSNTENSKTNCEEKEEIKTIRFKHIDKGRVQNKPAAQAAGQTLPDEPPPVGKINSFSKIAVTFEPIQRFRCPSRFRVSKKMSLSLFVDWKHHF